MRRRWTRTAPWQKGRWRVAALRGRGARGRVDRAAAWAAARAWSSGRASSHTCRTERTAPLLPQVRVIFITSHREYAIDAYALNIFRYVPKDELEKRLPQAILDAAKLVALEDGKSYTIQTAHRLEKLPLREILYIAREGKNVCFLTAQGAHLERTSLGAVAEKLDDPAFVYIDRGMIVNLVHVLAVKDGFAELDNGQRLPISRGHLAEVKAQLAAYWGALL